MIRRDPEGLLQAAAGGSRLALARLLTMVERGGTSDRAVAHAAYRTPPPYTVGITGAPGSGKSTLTDQLIATAREEGWPPDPTPPGAEEGGTAEPIDQLAVLAVDPSSPFSGGAMLGDRVRMQRHATDPSIFIRSLATRGHMGGLSLAVPDAIRVLGAAGIPLVVVETVGVGQVEVDVASAADTTVVVVTPGWGDAMQAHKAGLLEVADVFVVNKADRPGLRETRRDLKQMLHLSGDRSWQPEIVETVATDGTGIAALWAAIARHRAFLVGHGELARRRAARSARELERALEVRLADRVAPLLQSSAGQALAAALATGEADPYDAADQLLDGRLAGQETAAGEGTGR